MAIFKPSALVSDLRGKISNMIYSRNRSGWYVKSSFTPVNPNITYQLDNRVLFKAVTEKWNTISESSRQKWISAAAQYSKNNFFGDAFHPDGFHLFMSCNRNLGLVNKALIDDPHADNSLGNITGFSLAYTSGLTESFYILFDGQTVASNCRYLIYATQGLNQGVYSVRQQLKVIGYIPENTANDYDITSLYYARFPSFPSEQKVFLMLRPVNILSGFDGLKFKNSLVLPYIPGIGADYIGTTLIL